MRRLLERLMRWWRYRKADRRLAQIEWNVISSGEGRLAKARAAGDSTDTTEVAKDVDRERRNATNARLRLATNYYVEQAAALLLPLPENEWPAGGSGVFQMMSATR